MNFSHHSVRLHAYRIIFLDTVASRRPLKNYPNLLHISSIFIAFLASIITLNKHGHWQEQVAVNHITTRHTGLEGETK